LLISTMRKLIIEPSSSTPRVVLDPSSNRFEISGESRPPDVADFYGEILKWLNDYESYSLKMPEPSLEQFIVDLDFEYFNSSSAKYILDFCKKISGMHARGAKVGIRWFYEKGDSDMLEVGQVMSKTVKLPFEFMRKDPL